MTRKRHSADPAQPSIPYGSQPGRRLGLLLLLIVLYVGWVAFLSVLALHDYLRS